MFESARAEADRATAAWKAGEAKPLTGVPITIKDLVYVAGIPATAARPMLDGFVPDADSAVVTAVRAAGAIVTCKTTTCESGYKLTADSPVSGDYAQSVASWPHQRRIERRRCRRRRCGLRPPRDRHRWRRIDPRALVVLRRVRT